MKVKASKRLKTKKPAVGKMRVLVNPKKAKSMKLRKRLDPGLGVRVLPPKALEECPRCGRAHRRLKPLMFTKPMKFYGKGVDGKPFEVACAFYWVLCPRLKEPVIFYDRHIPGGVLEDALIAASVQAIAEEEDRRILAELMSAPPQLRVEFKRGKWIHAPKPKKGSPLVFNPNAPERMVPGTKKEAAAQSARVRAQRRATRERLKGQPVPQGRAST